MGAGDMSRDRIEFSIPFNRLTNTKYRNLVKECFGLTEEEIPKYHSNSYKRKFELLCRPSQFARFIVLRNVQGMDNMVHELDAKLITPEPPVKQPLPVWDRPNRVRSS